MTQTILITGAGEGIGLEIACQAIAVGAPQHGQTQPRLVRDHRNDNAC
jgi:NAD(P)-dependent dehydrogenase (short-subunit alcohol dehydrogenase family)